MSPEPCPRCGAAHAPEFCPAAEGAVGPAMSFDLLSGAKVGEYQVTGLLGQGGMGVVYSGIHPLLGRKVAIKVLSHQMARRDEATARFLQEARAASTLHHQNIVDVFAFGELSDGRYYQVMELLEGESLRSILSKRGALNMRQARTIIVGVLSGLGAAHRRGVVHRDIKPDNVFICGPLDGDLAVGDIKILDFGLAKRESAAEISIKTRTGVTMGTPAYMSPEQCRGMTTIDSRTDLYAAGVMLFEMLSGRTPFYTESAFDLMLMQINARPPRLAKLTGRPEPLEPVILKALGKRADERYATATDMLAAIEAALPPGTAITEQRRAPNARAGRGGGVPRGMAERETLVAGQIAGGPGGDGWTVSLPGQRLWHRRGFAWVVVGATVGVVVAGVSMVLLRQRHVQPAGSAPPAAATTATAAAAPAAAPAPPASAPAVAAPPETKPPPSAPRPKPAKKPRPNHKEGDVDSPLNPYAR